MKPFDTIRRRAGVSSPRLTTPSASANATRATQDERNPVLELAAADPEVALAHFESRLSLETDCWDVHAAQALDDPGFVLLDVRSWAAYARGHVPGAIQLHHSEIDARSLLAWGPEATFVVYCAGPHCNAADRAAARIAALGRRVKLMLGGIEGWRDEGLDPCLDGEACRQACTATHGLAAQGVATLRQRSS